MLTKYKKNNIIFRIASADAISKFKATQASSFVQLARKELAFDTSAKEVVLLEFDRFSHWISTIERIFISVGEKYIPPYLKTTVFDLFVSELNVIEGVMSSHPEVFTTDVKDFTRLVHKYISDIVFDSLEEILLMKADTAFLAIVRQVGNYLQHLLVVMHEFNENIVKKVCAPFLSASDFCVSGKSLHSCEPALRRAKYFMSMGIENKFLFKNYASLELFYQTNSYLSQHGINLTIEDLAISSIKQEITQ